MIFEFITFTWETHDKPVPSPYQHDELNLVRAALELARVLRNNAS